MTKIGLMFVTFLIVALLVSRAVDRLYFWNYYRKNVKHAKDVRLRNSLKDKASHNLQSGILWIVLTCVAGLAFFWTTGL